MSLRPLLLLLALVTASASAQDPVTPGATALPAFPDTPVAQGMSYFTFAEPGAPTVEVIFLGAGLRNGIYKLQQGTTLVQAIALAGGTPRSDSTKTAVTTALVRVIRSVGGQPQIIYQVVPERLWMELDQQPAFQDGDVVEMEVETEFLEPDKPFTWRDGIEIVSRVASVVSVTLLLYSRLTN